MNKASGGDGISVELFQILKDDAVKVLHLKKEFIGPGPHLRPVHADHAQPPHQWTLDSVLSAYGNYNRRIRPSLERGILKITSRLLIAYEKIYSNHPCLGTGHKFFLYLSVCNCRLIDY